MQSRLVIETFWVFNSFGCLLHVVAVAAQGDHGQSAQRCGHCRWTKAARRSGLAGRCLFQILADTVHTFHGQLLNLVLSMLAHHGT